MSNLEECLVMRADASSAIGTGHVMRCLALAQAWQQTNGRTIFASREITPSMEARLQAAGAQLVALKTEAGSLADAEETAALTQQEGARWVVTDGYHFVPGYQRALRASGASVLCIDDTAQSGRYESNLVLNQNVHATEHLYANRARETRLLLGPRYSLLRPEFGHRARIARSIPEVAGKILITFGGADPANGTRVAIDALQQLAKEDFEAIVVVGGSNPRRTELEKAAASLNGRLRFVYDASKMSDLMAWADLAVSAAGSTTLELASFGVPMLLVVLADNQEPVAARMEALNAAKNLDRIETLTAEDLGSSIKDLMFDPARRAQLSESASRLVDGRGALRVARILEFMQLRPARPDDARLLFEWSNEPAVRAASFNSAPIAWEEHVRWFQQKLVDPDAVLLIAENQRKEPLGVARFQIKDRVAVISVSVAPSACGYGLGRRIIEAASERVFARYEVQEIHALTRPENQASVRAFLAAGYREDTVSDSPSARLFVRRLDHA